MPLNKETKLNQTERLSSGIQETRNDLWEDLHEDMKIKLIRINMKKKDENKKEMKVHCGQRYGKYQTVWPIKLIKEIKTNE